MVDRTERTQCRPTLHVGNVPCQCRHWTDWASERLVMYHCSLGTILGVCNADRCTIRCQQEVQASRVGNQLSLLPKAHISIPESNGALGLFLRGCCVFPHSQEIEKGDDDQIRCCIQVGVPPIVCGNSCNGRDGNDQLCFCWWVLVAVFLDCTGNGEVK
jgi:hypothetical protein